MVKPVRQPQKPMKRLKRKRKGSPPSQVPAPSHLTASKKSERSALAEKWAAEAENLPHNDLAHDGAGGRRARFARGYVNARLKAHDANMSKDEAYARSRLHLEAVP